MIIITLNNISNLNVSLQVGDIVYATPTATQVGSSDLENSGSAVGESYIVGKLLNIEEVGGETFNLTIDETIFPNTYIPSNNDFIMFSKSRDKKGLGGDVNGYYAKANFKNNSTKKAELFVVSSEITINSK
tara:strand:+ start:25 stop:417 length:393 start_codon:yes stop_codon:yes gene_type:complete